MSAALLLAASDAATAAPLRNLVVESESNPDTFNGIHHAFVSKFTETMYRRIHPVVT